jgi:hypothetical protein
MKKSVGILFLLVIFFGIIFISESVSAWPWCGGLDCSIGLCPPQNSCPTASNPQGSESFYNYGSDYSGCIVTQTVTCNSGASCNGAVCSEIYFEENLSDGDNLCDASYCMGGGSVICAYSTRGKFAIGWTWWDPSRLPAETPSLSYGVCTDGIDNDCDNKYDYIGDGASIPGDPSCCVDADHDGYNETAIGVCGTQADCNDNNINIHPGAPEICDGKDNQCPGNSGYGQIDEGFNVDGDSFRTCDGDCNDNNASIYPGATEICTDRVDNNCNGYCDYNTSTCIDGKTPGDTACTGEACPNVSETIANNNCGNGVNDDCDTEQDWDTQNWVGGYPAPGNSGMDGGDNGCPVGFLDRFFTGEIEIMSQEPYYENTFVSVNCYTDVEEGVNSVNAYVIDGSKRYCSLIFTSTSFGIHQFNCSTGSPQVGKTFGCEINQSRSYNSTGDAILQKDILSNPPSEVSCQPTDSCNDYQNQTTCERDCNSIWSNDQPDNLVCGTGMCSSGTTWNACGCEWNGSACNFGYKPNPCGVCGNGLIEPGEECDPNGAGPDNITVTCSNVGSNCSVGTPSCTSSCTVDTSSCSGGGCNTGSCGDGAKNDRELCDGNNLGGLTCANFKLNSGTLSCVPSGQTNACHFDTSRCVNISAGGWCSVEDEEITKECGFEPDPERKWYEWIGIWYGGPGGADETDCEDDPFSQKVLCPSEFQLPFFGFYSIALSILGIAVVYYFLIRKKKIVLV